jgi:hypothetical protein
MIIFGGVGKFYTNEVIIFDLEQNKWEKVLLKEEKEQPPVLYGHVTLTEKNKLWVFGGKSVDTFSKGYLYYLDTELTNIEPIEIGRSNLSRDLFNLVNNIDNNDFSIVLDDENQFFCHRAIIRYLFFFFNLKKKKGKKKI